MGSHHADAAEQVARRMIPPPVVESGRSRQGAPDRKPRAPASRCQPSGQNRKTFARSEHYGLLIAHGLEAPAPPLRPNTVVSLASLTSPLCEPMIVGVVMCLPSSKNYSKGVASNHLFVRLWLRERARVPVEAWRTGPPQGMRARCRNPALVDVALLVVSPLPKDGASARG